MVHWTHIKSKQDICRAQYFTILTHVQNVVHVGIGNPHPPPPPPKPVFTAMYCLLYFIHLVRINIAINVPIFQTACFHCESNFSGNSQWKHAGQPVTQ